jgi:hypothetical protein
VLVAALIVGMALPSAGTGQELGFQAAEPIRRNQEFQVTFHRPNLKAGEVVWVNNADTVDAGTALSPEEIAKGFNVGDLVAIRVKAPVDCYVYGVNNSQWDGATLVENGEKLRAGVERDFVYRLTNRQGKQGMGNENIVFLIRRDQIPPADVSRFLQPAVSPSTRPTTVTTQTTAPQIRLGGTPAEQQTVAQSFRQEEKKAGKLGGILKVGCGVAGIFFPFVGRICSVATGFAAAEPVRRSQLQPTQDTQNLVVQFSFPVKP